MHVWTAVVCGLVAFPATGNAAARYTVSLNGMWQYQKVAELTTPPAAGKWTDINVPGTLRGYNYERLWYRRRFQLDPTLRGQRIVICFDGVKYNSRIYVNGRHVGGCFNGYDAFEVDVTDAVRFDRPNDLAVGCHDWTGVFLPGRVDFSTKPAWQRPRRFVKDKVIAPIGGHYDSYGIWGDVTLVTHRQVYVKDLFIKPSVRAGELVVDYTIRNASPEDVTIQLGATVEDRGKSALTIPAVALQIPAGTTVQRTVRRKWPTAHYWSHEDPYLYFLRTELSTGDVMRTRFGFREFWIEGHHYILNGKRVNLLASSWWPPTEPIDRAEVEQHWRALKACGVVCFRTHTQPWRRVHYDVADEVGLLMIIEGAMWHDPYCTAYDNPTYWDNYAKMIHAMIQREKNRPSVIMWSMENEAYTGVEKTRLAAENLARVGRMTKKWDPTRPIYFESDGDPGGVADAIGMHYVHEYPQYTCWPNEAYWLDKPFNPRTWFGIDAKPFRWDKKKPLYLGEFLWVPSGTPVAHTVFYGDDAYRDLDQYTRLAKGEAWKMQVLVFRHQEVGGMCPWTVGTDLNETNPLYRAHQYAYQHLAAFCLDYDQRFYSGEKVARRVDVFNDVMSDSNLKLQWELQQAGTTIATGSAPLVLQAGTHRLLNVMLPMPLVDRRTPVQWHVVLQRDGHTVFQETHQYTVYPQLELSHLAGRIGLYDPDGRTAKLLKRIGADVDRLAEITQLPSDLDVLVIGAGTLRAGDAAAPVIGRVDPQRGALLDFITRGGRVLVLRQDVYPEGLFEVGLADHSSTMTFAIQPSHPALRNLRPGDLKFWRGDNMVADHELTRPAAGAAGTIIVSGSKTGIAYTPLLERPLGRGSMVHCQLQLVGKATTEPAAAQILINLLDYLVSYQPRARRTAVFGADAHFTQVLDDLGLRFDDLTSKPNNQDLSTYSLVVLRGNARGWQRAGATLRQTVEDGGSLLVHRPTAQLIKDLDTLFDMDVTMQQRSGTAKRGDSSTGDPLLESITREDLYWTNKRAGLSWARQPLSREMFDGVFTAKTERLVPLTAPGAAAVVHRNKGRIVFDGIRWDTEQYNSRQAARYACALLTALDADFRPRPAVTIECEQMAPEPEMKFFNSRGGVAYMGCNGYIKTNVRVATTRRYALEVLAAGDACDGVCPRVELHIDGKKVATVQLTTESWRTYPLAIDLLEGEHQLALHFVNDQSSPNGDRNLRLDKVIIYN